MARSLARLLTITAAVLAAHQQRPAAAPAAAATTVRPRPASSLTRRPLSFEANRGQFAAAVDYVARGRDYTTAVSASGVVLSAGHRATFRMTLAGAAPSRAVAEEALPGRINYFVGGDRSAWRAGVPTYAAVRYPHVYRGIDIRYHDQGERLEYDFIVAPHADPSAIRLRFDGGQPRLDADGGLVVEAGGGSVRMPAPEIYQDVDGRRRTIAGGYRIDRRVVGFHVAAFDRELPLVIDPGVDYATFLGGAAQDKIRAVAVDAQGNAYVTGETLSAAFPGATQAAINGPAGGGNTDVFVAKLSPAGALLYLTFIGGTSDDGAYGIAVDSSNAAYVTGYTASVDFPTLNGYQSASLSQVNVHGFLVKLHDGGTALDYGTYITGEGQDKAFGVAADDLGHAYVTGFTTSHPVVKPASGFPVTMNAPQPVNHGNNDAFVMEFDTSASGDASLVYSTLFGGAQDDDGRKIAIDGFGNAYITGATQSSDLAVNGFKTSGSGQNAFLAAIDPFGGAITYSTYIGSDNGLENTTDGDGGIAALDPSHVYVGGTTSSTDLLTTANALHTAPPGGGDGFVMRVDTTQAGMPSLVWSTYIGGVNSDSVAALAVDGNGDTYLTGATSSPDLGATACAWQSSPTGGDAYLARLDADGSHLVYATYIGGKGPEFGTAVAVDQTGAAVVGGTTQSVDFPVTNGAFQQSSSFASTNSGQVDGFVARIPTSDCTADLSVRKIASSPVAQAGGPLSYTIAVSNVGPAADANIVITDPLPPTVTFVGASSVSVPAPACAVDANNEVTCTLATLAAGDSVLVTVDVQLTGPFGGDALLVSNTACATGDLADPQLANNCSTAKTMVSAGTADVSIVKTASAQTALTGADLTYTLTVTNNGPSTAKNVEVEDLLPFGAPGLLVKSITPSNLCTGPTDIVCQLGDMANGAVAVITIVVTPMIPGNLHNVALVSSATVDPVDNNASVVDTPVIQATDLKLAIAASPSPVVAGTVLTYTLQVTNTSAFPATGIQISDTLPGPLDFSTGTCGGSPVLTCTLASLPPNGMALLSFGVKVPAGATGSIGNTAVVSSAEPDLNPADNTAASSTPVTTLADLSITVDGPQAAQVNKPFKDKVRVKNTGPSVAATVQVTIAAPGLVLTAPGCSKANNALVCKVKSLAPGKAYDVKLTLIAGKKGLYQTSAQVTAATQDPKASNNTSQLATKIK